jgi:hypothetical protein
LRPDVHAESHAGQIVMAFIGRLRGPGQRVDLKVV